MFSTPFSTKFLHLLKLQIRPISFGKTDMSKVGNSKRDCIVHQLRSFLCWHYLSGQWYFWRLRVTKCLGSMAMLTVTVFSKYMENQKNGKSSMLSRNIKSKVTVKEKNRPMEVFSVCVKETGILSHVITNISLMLLRTWRMMVIRTWKDKWFSGKRKLEILMGSIS